MTTSVASVKRFTNAHPCPICGGHQALPSGQRRRCAGYLSTDGRYAHCTREEHAGALTPSNIGTFAHILQGACRCGVTHGQAQLRALPRSGQRQELRTSTYQILDPSTGDLLAEHVRTDFNDGSKSMRWKRGDSWSLGGMKVESLPLYGIKELLAHPKGTQVIVTEGEKAAAHLTGIGVPAVGTVTGSGTTPSDAVLGSLSGYDVVLWPDNDAVGSEHMHRIAERMQSLGERPRIIHWDDAPAKGDAADFLAAGGGFEGVQRLADAAQPFDLRLDALRGLEILSVSDLLALEVTRPECVVEGIMPTGLVMLAARPKIGKTRMVAGLSVAVASGGRALGKLPVLKGAVLALLLEDSHGRAQGRFEAILGESLPPERLFVATTWPTLDDGGIIKIEAWLGANSDARLVIIDTFARFAPKRDRKSDSYLQDYSVASELKSLADRHPAVTILCVTHTTKARPDDYIDSLQGTTGLIGAADTVMVLCRDRGRSDAVLKVTGRDIEEQEIALAWDDALSDWTFQGDADEFRQSAERSEIERVIREAGQPVGPKYVCEKLGRSGSAAMSVRHLLGRMVADGRLSKVGRGLYSSFTSFTSFTTFTPFTSDTFSSEGVTNVNDVNDVNAPRIQHDGCVNCSSFFAVDPLTGLCEDCNA